MYQTKPMPKAGICSAVATCNSKSTPRLTRRISKPSTAMAGIPPSGARLVCYTTRSISIVTPWMPTQGPSDSTPLSQRFGMTLAPCMSLATTRSAMLWMLINVPPNWIPTTRTLKPDCSCSEMGKLTAAHPREQSRCPPIFIPRRTMHPVLLVLRALSGRARAQASLLINRLSQCTTVALVARDKGLTRGAVESPTSTLLPSRRTHMPQVKTGSPFVVPLRRFPDSPARDRSSK